MNKAQIENLKLELNDLRMEVAYMREAAPACNCKSMLDDSRIVNGFERITKLFSRLLIAIEEDRNV